MDPTKTTGGARVAVPADRSAVGASGEDLACAHLVRRGMVVLDRNWRCPHGEIDVVARDGDVLVVCEVKTRRSLTHGDPVEAVTAAKVARLRRLAHAWRAEHPVRARGMRIDVIGVLARPGRPPLLRHVVGVGS